MSLVKFKLKNKFFLINFVEATLGLSGLGCRGPWATRSSHPKAGAVAIGCRR